MCRNKEMELIEGSEGISYRPLAPPAELWHLPRGARAGLDKVCHLSHQYKSPPASDGSFTVLQVPPGMTPRMAVGLAGTGAQHIES